jgi:hypothetical protein
MMPPGLVAPDPVAPYLVEDFELKPDGRNLLGTDASGIVVGNPVTGGDFFDRDREIGSFIDAISQGAHLLVTAPRRIGKSSLLLEAARRLQGRYHCLYVDVEACECEVDAVVKLAIETRGARGVSRVVLDAFRDSLGAVLDRIEEVGLAELKLKLKDGVMQDWRAKGDEMLARLADVDKPVVLLFDELPVLVSRLLKGDDFRITPERRSRAHVFLSWLREATIRHRGHLHFVVCGSIGLEPLLSQGGLSETMTTFTPFDLPPWDRDTACAYLKDRAARAGIEFQEGAEARVLDLLGYSIPQHVQMFMRFILEDAKQRDPRTSSPDDIKRLYKTKMLSVHGHVDLATYEDRLKRVVHPELLAAALEMLTEAAIRRRLKPEAAIQIVRAHVGPGGDAVAELRFLLALFTHDGYLKKAGTDYVFVSHLLRDWWKHRFGFGYVSVAKRSPEDR